MEIRRDVIQAVKVEIENMPVKYKFITLLWYFEQFTVVDISNILNIPEEIVEIRIDKVESLIRLKMDIQVEERISISSQMPFIVSRAFDLIIQNYKMPSDAENRIYGNIMNKCLS